MDSSCWVGQNGSSFEKWLINRVALARVSVKCVVIFIFHCQISNSQLREIDPIAKKKRRERKRKAGKVHHNNSKMLELVDGVYYIVHNATQIIGYILQQHALDWIIVQGDDNRLLMAQGVQYLLNIPPFVSLYFTNRTKRSTLPGVYFYLFSASIEVFVALSTVSFLFVFPFFSPSFSFFFASVFFYFMSFGLSQPFISVHKFPHSRQHIGFCLSFLFHSPQTPISYPEWKKEENPENNF